MEADPGTVLEWLKCSDARELQLTALEHLCNEVLFSDNVDKFISRYNPNTFFPAMFNIFSDELAPDYILETNARTLTYCLELTSTSCLSIKSSDFRVICTRLDTVDMVSEKSNEVGQQIIKVCLYF